MKTAATEIRASSRNRPGWRLAQRPARKKIAVLAMFNGIVLPLAAVVGDVGFTLFWQPNYRIRCERWWVGCGMTQAGRKYRPDSTYRIKSREFNTLF